MVIATSNRKVCMTDYNFWADFLDTFQSSPDWIKALWLLVPPCFLLGFMALMMRFMIGGKENKSQYGELVYSVHQDRNKLLHIVSHASVLEERPVLLFPTLISDDAYGTREPASFAPPP